MMYTVVTLALLGVLLAAILAALKAAYTAGKRAAQAEANAQVLDNVERAHEERQKVAADSPGTQREQLQHWTRQ